MWPMKKTKDKLNFYVNFFLLFESTVIQYILCFEEWRGTKDKSETILPSKEIVSKAVYKL